MSQKVNTYKVHLRYSRFVDKLAKEGQYKPEVHNELAAECVCVPWLVWRPRLTHQSDLGSKAS